MLTGLTRLTEMTRVEKKKHYNIEAELPELSEFQPNPGQLVSYNQALNILKA